MERSKEETLAWLRKISGELATATLKRLDDTLPWYGEMPPGRRSAVGLVAQAGISSFISWFDDPRAQTAVETYMPKEHAKIFRYARAQGMKPFGWQMMVPAP